MIRKNTTFVIGAGGSVPYHLRTARDLLVEIRQLQSGQALWQLVSTATGVNPEQLDAILEDVRNHPAESMDAILESRQDSDEMMRVGKALIVSCLGRQIDAAKGQSLNYDEDWMGYLIDKMRKGAATPEQFIQNNVQFVTFNFDTLLEQRLQRSLQAIYRSTPDKVDLALANFPVIHVHGSLPALTVEHFGKFVSMEAVNWVRKAALGINVVLEAIDAGVQERAIGAIVDAKVVCFLGFGYDPENLTRIGLHRRLKGWDLARTAFFGSAKNLRPGEQATVKRYFHERIDLAPGDLGCRDGLRAMDLFEE